MLKLTGDHLIGKNWILIGFIYSSSLYAMVSGDNYYTRDINSSQIESEDGYATIHDIDKSLVIEIYNGSTYDTKYEVTWEDSITTNTLSYKTKDIIFRGMAHFEIPSTAKVETIEIKGFSNGNELDDGVYNKIFSLRLDDSHVFYVYNSKSYFALMNKGGYYNSKLLLYKPTFGESSYSYQDNIQSSDHPNSCANVGYVDDVYGTRVNPLVQYDLVNECHFSVMFILSGEGVDDKKVEVDAQSKSYVFSPYWFDYERFRMYRTN